MSGETDIPLGTEKMCSLAPTVPLFPSRRMDHLLLDGDNQKASPGPGHDWSSKHRLQDCLDVGRWAVATVGAELPLALIQKALKSIFLQDARGRMVAG